MSPFYAYVINQLQNTHKRYLLIFADHLVADEWWRKVSKDPILKCIRRFTPQFYFYESSNIDLLGFFSRHKNVADNFIGRMSVHIDKSEGYDPRNPSILPPIEVTDHISGNWFHIRSKVDPRLYWYYEGQRGRIVLSEHHNQRTAFRVTALGEPEGTVMTGKDKVTITTPKINIGVHANLGGYLSSGGNTVAFMFQDFAQGKFAFDESGDLKHSSNIRAQREVWELVCSYNPPT